MKKSFAAITVLFAFMLCLISPVFAQGNPNSSEPIRIAVLPLRTGAGIHAWWEGGFDPGQAMTDILINKLIQSRRYLVFDRANLDTIMREQNLGADGRITPETAAEIGRLAGVQYIISGTVTEFSQVGSSGGAGVGVNLPFGVGVGVGNKKVRTAIEIHMTDVNSGLYGAGISAKDETVVGSVALGGYYRGVGVGYYNDEFKNSALGKSMMKLADNVASQLETVQIKQFSAYKPLEAYVVLVDGDQVYLNIGNSSGVVKGMIFAVSRARVVDDPVSGQKMTINKPLGEIKITSVEMDSCVGALQGENKGIAPKDKAKRIK